MPARKKAAAGARGAAAVKMIQAAEKAAMKAHADWSKSIASAVAVTGKEVTAATKKAAAAKARAAKALARVRKAKGPAAKAKARDARKPVLADLAAVNAHLETVRESHAAAKADAKLFNLIDKGLSSGVKAAEKAATKAAKPRKRRRRRRKQA